MAERYDPERSLTELRAARDYGDRSYREMYDICERAARRAAKELWADPAVAEIAGMGAVVAAASLARFAEPGRDAPILNAVGMLGLALVDNARAAASGAPMVRLTDRQHRMLRMVARGLSNPEIATAMSLGIPSVQDEMRRIFDTFDTRSRTNVVALGYEYGVLKPGDAFGETYD